MSADPTPPPPAATAAVPPSLAEQFAQGKLELLRAKVAVARLAEAKAQQELKQKEWEFEQKKKGEGFTKKASNWMGTVAGAVVAFSTALGAVGGLGGAAATYFWGRAEAQAAQSNGAAQAASQQAAEAAKREQEAQRNAIEAAKKAAEAKNQVSFLQSRLVEADALVRAASERTTAAGRSALSAGFLDLRKSADADLGKVAEAVAGLKGKLSPEDFKTLQSALDAARKGQEAREKAAFVAADSVLKAGAAELDLPRKNANPILEWFLPQVDKPGIMVWEKPGRNDDPRFPPFKSDF